MNSEKTRISYFPTVCCKQLEAYLFFIAHVPSSLPTTLHTELQHTNSTAKYFRFKLIYTQHCGATTYSLHSEALQIYLIFPHNIAEQQHTCSAVKPLKYFINFLGQFSLLMPILFLNVPVPYGPTLTDALTVSAVLLLDVYGDQMVIITCMSYSENHKKIFRIWTVSEFCLSLLY